MCRVSSVIQEPFVSPASTEDPFSTMASHATPRRVLICDDQADVLHAMKLLLKGEGYEAQTVQSPRALLEAALASPFDVILADLNYTRDTTSGEEGLDLLAALSAKGNQTPVVVMTAWGSINLAVEAMRRGACDFIEKPWDNQRVLKIVGQHAASRRKSRSEIEIAAAVQQRMLPGSQGMLQTIEYAGHCAAAQGVGGDFYDFLVLNAEPPAANKLAVAVGDVSGKGIPAALLMANLQASLRSQPAELQENPVALLTRTNQQFFQSTGADRFATLFYGIYDDARRALRYVNCGHCPPLLLRANGKEERLSPTALPLGAFAKWTAEESEVRLHAGDTLLIYSDGVSEAENARGEDFGEARLEQAVRSVATAGSAKEIAQLLARRVSDFCGSSQTDDLTVVAVRAR